MMLRRYVDAGCPAGNPSEETLKRAHKTIQLVTDHIERMRFNTALAAMMDQLNYLAKLKPEELGRFAVETYVLMLAPMAPHVAEEIWRALGHNDSVHLEAMAEVRSGADARDETVTIVVQITAKSATASKSPPAPQKPT